MSENIINEIVPLLTKGLEINMNFKTRTALLKDDAFLKSTSHLTNKELSLQLGLSHTYLCRFRKGIHHAVDGDNGAARGNVGEKLASTLLHANGIANDLMPWNRPFDILALGCVRIDVKIANTPITSPSTRNYKSPPWLFNVRKNKRDDADFYMCIISPTEEAFVIPAKYVPREAAQIRFCWPTSRPGISKWQRYLDAYDLIFRFADDADKIFYHKH